MCAENYFTETFARCLGGLASDIFTVYAYVAYFFLAATSRLYIARLRRNIMYMYQNRLRYFRRTWLTDGYLGNVICYRTWNWTGTNDVRRVIDGRDRARLLGRSDASRATAFRNADRLANRYYCNRCVTRCSGHRETY